VFRTPAGARVGREPFEAEVLRQIEAQHPDIAFDWAVVRDNQQIIESSTEPRRRRPRREGDEATPTPAPENEPKIEPSEPRREPAAAAPPPPPPVPSRIQGATPDEQVAFLVVWYPRLRERVLVRITDPARQETLLALTERLNPSAWTDADQITAGLQAASEALERLAHVLTKRRRRPRRKRPAGAAAPTIDTAVDPADPANLTDSDDPADEGPES
jgi:hypothetical protein